MHKKIKSINLILTFKTYSMKKITLFILSLLLTVGAMAQIDTSKEYRIKDIGTGNYLNAANHDEHSGGTNGGVTVAAYAESNEQIFTFEASGSGYYLKTKSGYYIYCQQWNVDALSKKSLLTFVSAGNGNYYIMNGSNYFKVESVGGVYYPFCDAPSNLKATWALEPVITGPLTYTVKVLGTDAAAGVVFEGTNYAGDATFSTENVVSKSTLTAIPVDGKIAVVTVDKTTVYVSYFDANTKFYTIMNGKGGYVSLNPEYISNGELMLSNKNTPRDNQGIWAFVKNGSAYKVYNYSTGLSKVIGMTGSEASARAKMVDPSTSSYTIEFDGTLNFGNGEPSYIKWKGTSSQYWNDRNSYLALWNSSGAIGDTGSKFFLEEVDYVDYPDEYIHEISEIEGVASYSPKNPNTLWYKTSAEAAGVGYPWMEYALPLGNGELGCMVFGGVRTEELQFNEKTLWSGPANQVGADSGNRTFMNFGSLLIANNDNAVYEGVTDYVRYLDIEEGVAGVEFKNGNGTKQVRKYFASAPDQVIAGQYKTEGADKLNLTFMLEPGAGIGAGNVTYKADGTAEFTGAMTSVNFAARMHVVADEGATVTASGKGITVKNATEVTFYLKGATNFNGDMEVLNNYFTTETPADVNDRVKGEIEAAINKGYAAVEADHIADFTAITKRMTFDLGLTTPTVDTKTLVDNYYPNNSGANSTQNDHLFLEQLYFHYGRYLAISSNRKPIAAPNNLQGIWNDRGADSPWNSDIHTNINIQMNYWPTEITNLSDLHKPFVNFIIRGAQSDGWKKVGEQYNNGYGWSVLTESSLYNSMSTWGNNYLVANVWYTSHLWTHYRYTQDKEFLKKAFPVMWSCAEFWFHRLIKDRRVYDDTYVAPNEFSAEQHGNESEDGTAHAQQMISYLFQNLTDAIEILGVENTGLSQADVEKLALYLEKTDKGLHTETYDGGWGNPFNGVKSGELLLREWKYSPYSVGERGHRHISHLMALFPMDQITPESEYFVPAVNALKHRGDAATGWSMGWKVNLWARAQDGDHAHIIIKNALKHSTTYGTDQGQGGIYYNLFDSHAPFQIDGNFGVCSGMAEMLLQSAHGYVNILPALPAVWEKGGNVTGMKAMGNFTVDFNWVEGKCQKATITSNAGAELKVRCARGAMALDKAKITVNGAEVPVEVLNGVATIPCAKDDVVEIDFTTETAIAPVVSGDAQRGNGAIYDLSGRRINGALAGQVYIENGVKKLAK